MDVAVECLPCVLQSCLRLLDEGGIAEDRREDLIRRALQVLADADWRRSPPALAQELHAALREALGDTDPYRQIKLRSNLAMLEQVPELRVMLAGADDPFAAAARLAVAGNVIDFGARHRFDPAEAIERVLSVEMAVDDLDLLRADLAAARSVLYIGDNAGEIVLDRLFLDTVAHEGVTFAVRGGPVINDATLEDANLVGLPTCTRVITTGSDAPGAIPEGRSAEFQQALDEADVVIAKGQGNLEGLWEESRDIHFLLTVKCERVARLVDAPLGGFMAWKRRTSA
ncbi:MAG: DUF89 family protein [bacterium]|nr:DUF89 family protein [bacterium]